MQLLLPATAAALIAAAAISATTSDTPARGNPVPATSAPVVAGSTAATGATASVVSPPSAARSSRGGLGFGWPLSPRPAVYRRFEQPVDQWSPGHRGADLVAAVGEPVLSAGDEVVAFSGVIANRGVITIRHAGGMRTTYEPVDERLTSGTLVHRGSRIGMISATAGHCVPLSCLHWGAISGRTYRDPLSLLGFGQPILLPLG